MSGEIAASRAPAEQTQTKVQVRLTTRHPDIQLPEDPGVLLVSSSLGRYALSTLVNNLLDAPSRIPFEFLINGQFLRTSIDEFLTANGISSETVLNVEYVRALIPPQYAGSLEHDDWVSSLDVLSGSSAGGIHPVSMGEERILSGSYDGLLRVWNSSAETLATSTAPDNSGRIASIKAVRFLAPSKLVSAGLDMTIRLWNYVESGNSAVITPSLELQGHKWAVETLDVHARSSRVLSGSADHTVGIWSSEQHKSLDNSASRTPLPSGKRHKSSDSHGRQVAQQGPLNLLHGHSGPVQSVMFAPHDATVAHSVSLDHTLRTWDLPTGTLVDTRTTSHPLLSLTALSQLNLLASGTSARHITVVDPRVSATSVAALTLRGHSNAVVSLAPSPFSAYTLLSGSHDGTCRIWDIRSVRSGKADIAGGQVGESLYTIERDSIKGKSRKAGVESAKVFEVRWDKNLGILSAGEDKRIQINKSIGGEQV